MKDYYYILGITNNASKEEIKNAYRKLSLKFHPGQNDGEKFWEEKFTEINEAYETLIDNEERKKYDEKLAGKSAGNTNTSSQSEHTAYNKSGAGKGTPPPPETPKTKSAKSGRWSTFFILLVAAVLIYRGIEEYNKGRKGRDMVNAYLKNSQQHPVDSPNTNQASQDTTIPASRDTAIVVPDNETLDSVELKNEHDESDATKQDTENWIIDEFEKNTYDTTITDTASTIHQLKLADIYFTKYDLVISMNDEHTSGDGSKSTGVDKINIPVADIRYVAFPNNIIIFGTFKKIIKAQYYNETENARLAFFPFYTSSETSIAESMRKAFLHLQKFYQLPDDDDKF